LISGGLPNLPWEASNIPTTDTPINDHNVNRQSMILYDYGRGLWLREHGSPWMFEYMPVEALPLRSEFFLSAGPAPETGPSLAVQVTPGLQRPLERHFSVNSAEPWTMQLHQFYFPGWEAVVDGVTVPAQPVGDLALAGVPLPAGEHQVVFRFGLTAPRRLGWALTAMGALVWLAGAIWLRRWRWLAVAGVVVLVYGGLVLLQRMANPADYTPAAAAATFDGEAQLVGAHLHPEELWPGRESTVTLNWLALRRPATDYKVFVHLVDSDGKLWAQHDGEPGFFFTPTTRWQPGELIEDHHGLEWQEPGALPSGHYLLFAGLYDPATGNRLPVVAPDGTPSGDQVLLAEFDVQPVP
jgi:hypothetical protein